MHIITRKRLNDYADKHPDTKISLNQMLKPAIKNMVNVWPVVSNVLYVPHTEKEYNQLVILLDSLIDEIGEEEDHSLASLMDIIGTLIEKY